MIQQPNEHLIGQISIITQMVCHLIQAAGFVDVAVDAVLHVLGSKSYEVDCLALHGPNSTHLEHEPVHGFRLALQILHTDRGTYTNSVPYF